MYSSYDVFAIRSSAFTVAFSEETIVPFENCRLHCFYFAEPCCILKTNSKTNKHDTVLIILI